MQLQAPLLPAHSYTLEVLSLYVNDPDNAEVYSDEAFGRQPLVTREQDVPDLVTFTSQRLPEGMHTPLSSSSRITSLQVQCSPIQV